MSIRTVILILIGGALFLGAAPTGIIATRQIERAIIAEVIDDVSMAGDVVRDRWDVVADARMMHAADIAGTPRLPEAVQNGDVERATRIVADAASLYGEMPVIRLGGTTSPADLTLPAEIVAATRRGEMPVTLVAGGPGLYLLSLAPVKMDTAWMGAAGGATPFDDTEASVLAGLTRSEIVVLNDRGEVVASTISDAVDFDPARAVADLGDATVIRFPGDDGRFVVSRADLPGGARVLAVKDLDAALSALPSARSAALIATSVVVLVSVLVAVFVTNAVTRPIADLARTAQEIGEGRMPSRVSSSAISELDAVARSLATMRDKLQARMQELREANDALEDRQQRLTDLQAELVHRERAVATGQLVQQLAHEIRNPIASVRNCLEVINRKTREDPELQSFANMAIDELLRMHELAERMLGTRHEVDGTESADVGEVAATVAALVSLGESEPSIEVRTSERHRAAIAPDALKQVLFNLVLNAVEAAGGGEGTEISVERSNDRIIVYVRDNGPGISEEALSSIFDPFYSTKKDVHGVGLGLFIADATTRMFGGTIAARNRPGGGAEFAVALRLANV